VDRLVGLWAVALLLPSLMFAPVRASATPSGDLAQAVSWLRAQQQADGGFSNGVSDGSDLPTTADAVVAIVSAGEAPSDWTQDGNSPLDYLAQAAGGIESGDAGKMAKLVMALQASGGDPRDFAGKDWVAALQGGWDSGSRLYAADVYSGALGILALRAAGADVESQAVDGLLSYRLPDGSFSFNGDATPGSGDSNTTALAAQALIAAGAGADALAPSLTYFRDVQNADGGWTYQKPSPYGEATDANSTAVVLQALLAAGESPDAWGDPAQALFGLQTANGGLAFNADTPGDNLLATVQAIPALAGYSLVRLPQAGTASAGPASNEPFPMTVTVIEILVILLVGAAIAYRRSN
jgi:hypothetical protein